MSIQKNIIININSNNIYNNIIYDFFDLKYINCVYNKTSNNPIINNTLSMYVNNIIVNNKSIENINNYKNDSVFNISLGIYNNLNELPELSFSNANELNKIIFPDGIIRLNDYCFDGCTNLSQITFPNSLISIGSYIFNNCYNLRSIPAENLLNISEYSFANCGINSILLDNRIIYLPRGLFKNCINLKQFINDKVEFLEDEVFAGCKSLHTVIVSDNLHNTSRQYDFEDNIDTDESNEDEETIINPSFHIYTKVSELYVDITDLINIILKPGNETIPQILENTLNEILLSDEPETLEKFRSENFTEIESIQGLSEYISFYQFYDRMNEYYYILNYDINVFIKYPNGKIDNEKLGNNQYYKVYDNYIDAFDSFDKKYSVNENIYSTEDKLIQNIDEILDNYQEDNSIINIDYNTKKITIYSELNYYPVYTNSAYNNTELYYIHKDKVQERIDNSDENTFVPNNSDNICYYIDNSFIYDKNEKTYIIYQFDFVGIGFDYIDSDDPNAITKHKDIISEYEALWPKTIFKYRIFNSIQKNSLNEPIYKYVVDEKPTLESVEDLSDENYGAKSIKSMIFGLGDDEEELENQGYNVPHNLFNGCKSLSNISFYNIDNTINIKNVGIASFMDCQKLTFVPKHIKYINKFGFKNCNGITQPVDLSECTHIGSYSFENCNKIPEFLINVELSDKFENREGVFKNCKSLESIYLYSEDNILNDQGLSIIGKYLFYSCENLINIYTKDIIEIKEYGFSNCRSLKQSLLDTKLSLPNCTKIGKYAFESCESIEEFDFTNNDELQEIKVSEKAFSKCKSLKKINIKLDNSKLPKYLFSDCSALEEIKFENQIDLLENETEELFDLTPFTNCTNLNKIIFEDSDKFICRNNCIFYIGSDINILLFVPKNITLLEINNELFNLGNNNPIKINDHAFDNCKLGILGINYKINDTYIAPEVNENTFNNIKNSNFKILININDEKYRIYMNLFGNKIIRSINNE